jgi:hypothetical protein
MFLCFDVLFLFIRLNALAALKGWHVPSLKPAVPRTFVAPTL